MAGTPPSSLSRGLPLGLTGATAATRYVGATAAGAPASGTFEVGDFVVSQAGILYVCTVAGTPGTWVAGSGGTPTLAQVLAAGAAAGAKITNLTDGAAAQDAASVLQVAKAGAGGVAWTVVVKPGDTSRSATTVAAADPDLTFTPANGSVYEVYLAVVYASPAGAGTPDMKISFGEDGTKRGAITWLGLNTSDTELNALTGCATNSTNAYGTAAANRIGISRATYIGSGAAAGFYWAQNTSDANATIVRAGSLLAYRLIA